ncbi:MAG: helix-turn-helix domain-containing protein [Sphingobacteriia bacterium]|jgi:DNA-binding MarR family transcriptional regulator|nr:helix-turn-helix domain-containing protein [Candidatus Fonsibacter lacus]
MFKKSTRFGIVAYEVISDPNLSVQAKALYSMLACYANKERTCWPSISTLSDDLNISQSSTNRLIKELKTCNYIKRVGRKLTIK